MTDAQISAAATMWRHGLNTYDIAKNLRLPEHVVCGFLSQIKNHDQPINYVEEVPHAD